MKFILYSLGLFIILGAITVMWLGKVPVVRVLEVQKVNAQKAFEVEKPYAVNLFFVPEKAIVGDKIRVVRAGHVAELTVIPSKEAEAPEGKVTVLAPLQDHEMTIIPPYGDIPVGAQVRGERFGSGYSTVPIPLVNDK